MALDWTRLKLLLEGIDVRAYSGEREHRFRTNVNT
jgi:hypothetical protein